MLTNRSELKRGGINWLDSSSRRLLEIAQVNFWEWDIHTNNIIDFGHRPSVCSADGAATTGTLEYCLSQIHPDDISYVMENINRAINSPTNPEYKVKVRILKKNSREYEHILARGRALFNGSRQAFKIVGVWFSIQDLTLSNQNEKLQQAAMARFNRATSMGEIASRMSHELSQPLAASAMYLDRCIDRLIKDSIGKAELTDALQKASDHLHMTGEIVHRIKNFIRRGELKREYTELSAVLEGAVKLTEISYDLPVSITIRDPGNIPPVYVDRQQIMQVLLNLLNNSYDALIAAKTPCPTITVEIHRRKNIVFLKIIDNGPGIHPVMANHLFMPFYSTKKDGFGMGLAAARSIIDAHNGSIQGRKLPQGGSRFIIALPLTQSRD